MGIPSIYNRIMDYEGLSQLELENAAIRDPQERQWREEFLARLEEAITEYDVHVREYAYRKTVERILRRGVTLKAVRRRPVVKAWDAVFSNKVSRRRKLETPFYSNQFRWHLFSFHLLSAKSGDAARKAFDEKEKGELYLFFDEHKAAYAISGGQHLSAADLDRLEEYTSLSMADLYFFDPWGQWTYVVPHESECGPYFMEF